MNMTKSLVKLVKTNREWALTRFEILIKKSRLDDADAIEAEFREWVDLSSELENIEVLSLSVLDK